MSAFAMDCPNLHVPPEVMRHVVNVESGHNPYAIGVVDGRLERQPRNLREAVATARMLEERGRNYSLGAAQVNRANLKKTGLDTYERAFDYCANLTAGSKILSGCFQRAGHDWSKAFSCYYSGNFVTGFKHGYVQRVVKSMAKTHPADDLAAKAARHASIPAGRAAPKTPRAADDRSDPASPRESSQPFVPEVRRPAGVASTASPPPHAISDGSRHDSADLRTGRPDSAFVF